MKYDIEKIKKRIDELFDEAVEFRRELHMYPELSEHEEETAGRIHKRIVIRAYPPLTNYLRTLPLHHSQKEVETTPDYADFEFYLRPTFDFRQELLSQGNELEVLKPSKLREEMKKMMMKMLERYQQ